MVNKDIQFQARFCTRLVPTSLCRSVNAVFPGSEQNFPIFLCLSPPLRPDRRNFVSTVVFVNQLVALPDAEKMRIYAFVGIQYYKVRDGRRDRQTDITISRDRSC